MIINDSLIIFKKKFQFPNDHVMKVPEKFDRACSHPLGYLIIYEFSLRVGLQFPHLRMGLIVFFRDRGAVLTAGCFSQICRFTCDMQGHITFRFKWLDIRTRDLSKSWVYDFFSCRIIRICWKSDFSLNCGENEGKPDQDPMIPSSWWIYDHRQAYGRQIGIGVVFKAGELGLLEAEADWVLDRKWVAAGFTLEESRNRIFLEKLMV
ncbi:hypothetical protein IEQ34_007809 [Dendrobium chrysotoxum]|uniref:Uncharacterized protein n=1 Tax=Dendrobium chrysotoxum TaxID=161865 RepID=A0AAV7H2X0_DENCH|nr:hypothetical protein IEQ34_007809 [Dendrobium chrysotoxum]